MNWKTIEHDGLPKPKTVKRDDNFLQEASVELLCYDGHTVWHDFYDPEMDREHYYNNVTHYIRVDEIPVPNN